MSTHVRDRFAREYGITSEYDLAQLQAVLDEHAHELAEEIRAWVNEPATDAGAEEYGSVDNVLEAADRIDPEVQR
ncbi:hypothetical protein [Streptomyces pseudovenezuelae]|uniref:hypothetical protein n=1 Tax=Streptomyces pseudovenezuelae TaxID=67350 RepID=UPI002E319061|nr:hypothetical protein [Streptomyces pseudovenezuelae]